MKRVLTAGLVLFASISFAQTNIEKSFPIQGAQKLVMNFDYPQLIKIRTWDKKEVRVTGKVSINRGENDNAFKITESIGNNILTISSRIEDKENIPHRIMIKKGDQEYYFKAKDYNDPVVQKFIEENGSDYNYMSNGIVKEIELEVFVPRGMECKIEAKYGMVEVKDFDAPLTIDAIHGGIDATIVTQAVGELYARTRHGEILSNLDVKFNSPGLAEGHHDHWTEISAKLGRGPRYSLESKYGKVYLRRPN